MNSHLLSYGVNFCFIMGPAELNFICSGLKMEPSWETNSECRKKQSTTHSPESLVIQKLCLLLQWMYPPVLMSLCHALKFYSQDCVSLSKFLKIKYVWLNLRVTSVASMDWGKRNLILLVFPLVGIKLPPTNPIHDWKPQRERYKYRKWVEMSREVI